MSIVVNITSPAQFTNFSRFGHIEGTIGHTTTAGETVTSVTAVSLSFNGSAFSSTGVTFSTTSWQFNGFIPTNAPTNAFFTVIVRVAGKAQEVDHEFTPPRIRTITVGGDSAPITYFMVFVAPTVAINQPIQSPVSIKSTDLPYHAKLSGTASEAADPNVYSVQTVKFKVGNGVFNAASYAAGAWNADIPLQPGSNLITIQATDQWGMSATAQQTIVVHQYTMPNGVVSPRTTTDLHIPTTASITSWTRLEPQVNGANMGMSSNARVFDPAWMMTRQWQIGEFQSEDAGTPVQARLRATTAPLSRIRFGEPGSANTKIAAYNPMTLPLETAVERRATRAANSTDLRALPLRVEAGLHFLRMLSQATTLSQDYAALTRSHWALAALTPSQNAIADDETRRFVQTMSSRAVDGDRLAAFIRSAPGGVLKPLLSLLGVASADQTLLASTMQAWLAWYDHLFSEGPGLDAWTAPRLEYAASVAARVSTANSDSITLSANEFDGGRLDWSSFDVDPTYPLDTSADAVGTPLNQRSVPVPVTFPGAPAPRFWEMEDAKVAYGLVPVGPTDLAHLMMIEYAGSYGNDWYLVPLDIRVGTLTRVDSLVVTDTFGVRSLIRPMGDPALSTPYFSMWQQSGIRRAGDPANGPAGKPVRNLFFLPPTINRSIDGPVIEDVLFMRDEMANVAWAIERNIESGMESSFSLPTNVDTPEGDSSPATTLSRYLLSSTVPANWVPLLPVQIDPSLGLTRLQRGAVLQPDGSGVVHTAQSDTLKGLGTQLLYDEEVPREGVHITRRRRMVRWMDGSSWVWTANRNDVGTGEGSAGLQFDQLLPTDNGDSPSSTRPTMSAQLSVDDVVINGAATPYTVTVNNPGSKLAGVSLQGWLTQGAVRRAAGGTLVTVGSGTAVLPNGACTVSGTVIATNTGNGTGTLVLGPAMFELQLKVGASVLTTTTVPVTVVHQPTITALTPSATSAYIDGMATSYTTTLENLGPTLSGASLQGFVTQGTARRTAGANAVDCGSGAGVLPHGTFNVSGAIGATNGGTGTGTLIPGNATFELQLLDGSGAVLNSKTVPVTLAPNTPVLGAPSPAASSVIIGGSTVSYSTTLQNPGPSRSNVVLQGFINQGTARRAAGGLAVNLGAGTGVLPTGLSFDVSGSIVASNTTSGTGTLVPGAATFELQLLGNGTTLGSQSVPVTLEPNTPWIQSLTPNAGPVIIDGPNVSYSAAVKNPGAPVSNVVLQGFISQGTVQHAAGGAAVDCGAGIGVLPTGVFTLAGSLGASNNPITGSGTFVPGPATFLLQLKVNGSVVYSTTFAITLQTQPTIAAMTLQSSAVVLGSTCTSYQTSYTNPGSNLPNVALQGWISQGTARRSAVGPFINFGSGAGVLPSGSGALSASFGAFNTTAGTGTLGPGAANFELQLTQGADVLATATAPVTIVPCPTLTVPSPTSTHVILEGPGVPYTATLNNGGPSLSNVSINCLVRQGTTWRRSGNAITDFGSGAGVAPAGATALPNSILASNSQGGTGTLVAGPATVEWTVVLFNTYALDTRTMSVVLEPKTTIVA